MSVSTDHVTSSSLCQRRCFGWSLHLLILVVLVCNLQICTHSDFELIVMLLIFGNCISLALYDPLQSEHSLHNDTLTKFGAQGGVGCV